jgi:peptidoglycan hydrolase-like protein with peptidoglycan-binding domain
MIPLQLRIVLAEALIVLPGTLILSLALPAWTAEEKKAAPMKEEEPKKAPVEGRGDTQKLQEALKAKGHDPGPIDGIMGPKTRAALKAFQEASGITATGKLDDQTAEKLGVAKPLPGKEVEKEGKEKKEEKK